jgi:methylenetetrahydrofolate dehydrogenase (NADP+)/methenyltetrahydrofolate cyclohydrolase
MPEMMDGTLASRRVLDAVASHARRLAQQGLRPGLATVLVGENPASQVYVRSKGRRAEECGFHSVQHCLPADTSTTALLSLIEELNADPAIHGILVQLPLPAGMDSHRIMQGIAPHKDVDGFHFLNVGKLGAGQGLDSAFLPCTPAGAMLLLHAVHGQDLSGLHAVVLGRSNIVGKPMAALLLAAHATVTVAHSRSPNLPTLTRQADILVAAVGQPGLVQGHWIKPGATVIDVGINRIEGENGQSRLVGDVDAEQAMAVAAAMTPVPGGVGPMTIAMLMANTLQACCRTAGLPAWQATLTSA